MRFGGKVAGVCLLILGSPALARGQQFETPRLTIGASAGISNPLHGDLQFLAPAWDVSVRGQTAPHLIIEAFGSQWRRSERKVYGGFPLTGPNGTVGRVAEVTTDQQTRVDVFGFSFLPAFTAGRVTVAGGGGPALMVFRNDFVQRLSGCEATNPNLCVDHETHRTSNQFAVALVGTVDVRLARYLTVFGEVRSAVPTEDPGSGHITATGGIRLVVK